MKWVKANTSVPVPAVVRFDAGEANPLGHEDGTVVPGRVVDETFWQAPDIERYWAGRETVSSLNVGGPYRSYSAFCAGYVDKFVYAIERHDRLAWMRDLVPRLRTFAALLSENHGVVEELGLDGVKLILAHKDLHFANIMLDPLTGKITSILDWEFAGIVPASRWNPVKAFLWNTKQGAASKKEQNMLMSVFGGICKEKGIAVLEDARVNEHQEAMQGAIVEVGPRGEKEDALRRWRGMAEESLAKFKV